MRPRVIYVYHKHTTQVFWSAARCARCASGGDYGATVRTAHCDVSRWLPADSHYPSQRVRAAALVKMGRELLAELERDAQ